MAYKSQIQSLRESIYAKDKPKDKKRKDRKPRKLIPGRRKGRSLNALDANSVKGEDIVVAQFNISDNIVSPTDINYSVKEEKHPKIKVIEEIIETEEIIEQTVKTTMKECLDKLKEKHFEEIRKVGEQVSFNEGFIYIITNPMWNGWYKVGKTIDYEKRLITYNIGDPLKAYKIEALRFVNNRNIAEDLLIKILIDKSEKYNGEWFKIDEETIFEVFESITL